jgi:UDP-glucose 4-epimerase
MSKHKVTSVIHLAALKQVGASVENPEEYFNKNLGGQANLLLAMRSAGVKKLVFSSSAAAYGVPDVDLVSEEEISSPINPYGQTKLIGEWMAANAETSWGLRHVNLRYFNVAGAGWDDLADTQVLNLIPIVFEAIRNKTKPKVYGADYNTTGVDADEMRLLLEAIWHKRRLGNNDYQTELDRLIYGVLGKII